MTTGDIDPGDEGVEGEEEDEPPPIQAVIRADPTPGANDRQPDESRPVIGSGSQDPKEKRHWRHLRAATLRGLGWLFLLTLLTVVIATSFGGITEDLADRLSSLIFPTLMAAAATIVGTLFNDRSGDN